MTALNRRKPTGRVNHPFILVEGEEKAGKSFSVAKLAESKRIGEMFWIDLGEGTGDEYADPNEPLWDVLVHDGTYSQVIAQIEAARAYARDAVEKGDKPVVLAIDSGSVIWEGLKDWVTQRALNTRSGRASVKDDANAEVKISRNLWNDAGTRYRRLMTLLMTFPGVVVMTARGKEVSATDPNTGQPYRDGRRTWSVEGHRSLQYDVDHVIRFTRSAPPTVVGCRSKSPLLSIRPGVDQPKELPLDQENLLDWFIFDALGYDLERAQVRDLQQFTGGDLLPEEITDEDGPMFGGEDTIARDEFLNEITEALALPLEQREGALRATYSKFGERTLVAMRVQDPAGNPCTGMQLMTGWVNEVRAQVERAQSQTDERAQQGAPAQEPARTEEAAPAQTERAPEPETARAPEAETRAQEPAAKRAADEYQETQTARAERPRNMLREFLLSELEGQAAVLGAPSLLAYTAHMIPNGKTLDDVDTLALRAYAVKQRAGVIEGLRAQGRVSEADAYASVSQSTFLKWEVLTGTAGVDEPAQDRELANA